MNHHPICDQTRVRLILERIAKAGDIYEDFCHCPGCHRLLNAELVQYGTYPLPWAWCATCHIGVRMHLDCWYEIVNMNKEK